MRATLRLCLASLLLVGCGSGSIELTAIAATDISAIPAFTPSTAGNRLIEIEVRLQNDAGEDIPMEPNGFRLDPVAGVSVRASDLSERRPNSCVASGSAVLPAGGGVTCVVAFEVDVNFDPSVIAFVYEDYRAEDGVPALTTPDLDAGPRDDDGGVDGGPGPVDDGGASDAGRRDAGPAPPPTDQVDLLFMIDNSNSLVEEQSAFASQLPRLLTILTTGDADEDGDFYGDLEPGDRDFPPIVSLNLGVITPDMGTGGFTIPTCANSQFGDDGVMRTQGNTSIPGCMAAYPTFLNFQNGGGQPIGQFAADAACVAVVGVGGCGFEQQLESVLKALSPEVTSPGVAPFYTPPSFFQSTPGHGDRGHNGFLRADSVLGVFLFTDEEDCSVSDPELFNPSSATYTSNLNLRCFTYGDVALHPVSRFVDGLTQLRDAPSRLAYVLVAGVPPDLVPAPGDPINWDPLISDDPSVRDDRLEERIDPGSPNQLVPSCNAPGTGLAFPPIRMMRVGRELELNGANVGLSSICSLDLSGAVDALVEATGLSVRR